MTLVNLNEIDLSLAPYRALSAVFKAVFITLYSVRVVSESCS